MPPATQTSDEDLALWAASGDRSAFDRLVERHAGRVLAVLERRLGDHHQALDLAQEAWIRVYHALGKFEPGRNFRSWLFAIVLNGARDEFRRRTRSRVIYMDDFSAVGRPAQESDQQEIEAALLRVGEPFRTSLILVDIEGLSYEEAAEAQEIAVGTAKSRVNRGRAAFRDAWRRASGETDAGAPAGVGL
ncbi:MAG: RNA polymerase sigma-70 factor (ECF subfamily) [Planctomycetota bacterium]|jgi:RNA polymerase sigma-70 factor (ECF subfamily)